MIEFISIQWPSNMIEISAASSHQKSMPAHSMPRVCTIVMNEL